MFSSVDGENRDISALSITRRIMPRRPLRRSCRIALKVSRSDAYIQNNKKDKLLIMGSCEHRGCKNSTYLHHELAQLDAVAATQLYPALRHGLPEGGTHSRIAEFGLHIEYRFQQVHVGHAERAEPLHCDVTVAVLQQLRQHSVETNYPHYYIK